MSTSLRSVLLLVALCGGALGLATPASAQVIINEIDADQVSTDSSEFVELRGPAGGSLNGMVLVFFNGSNDLSYATFDLASQSLGADGLFVLCANAAKVANCDLDVSPDTDLIQNGQDAIALYMALPASFPNNTAPTTTGLIDAVVYGTFDPRDPALLAALGETVQFDEGVTAVSALNSIQRLLIGTTPSDLLYLLPPTPGVASTNQVTVNRTSQVADLAGYRFVGSPVVRPTGAPLTVNNYAQINLVQGVPAGGGSPAQYANAGDNFFPSYFNGAFLPAPNTNLSMFPGRGAAWYFYDQDITPPSNDPTFGPGTSVSYELTNPAFQLTATGTPVDNAFFSGSYSFSTAGRGGDGFFLIANPLVYPLRLGGVAASQGTLSTTFQTYDPAANMGAGSYVLLTANTADPFSGDALAVWNGAFAEVLEPAGGTTATSFIVSSNFADPTSNVTFLGREAAAMLALDLSGVLADGTPVADLATQVRLVDDALVLWDRHDASKLNSPAEQSASLAIVGDRNGETRRQAVLSLPTSLVATETFPVAFAATQAGSFTLTASGALSAGLQAQLRDLVTGTVLNLMSAASYAFTADAGAWSDRFELVIGQNTVATGDAPEALLVGAVAPNPTTGMASLRIRQASAGAVAVTVFDALGRQVGAVADASPGTDVTIALPTAGLAPGAYIVRVEADGKVMSRRLTVLR